MQRVALQAKAATEAAPARRSDRLGPSGLRQPVAQRIRIHACRAKASVRSGDERATLLSKGASRSNLHRVGQFSDRNAFGGLDGIGGTSARTEKTCTTHGGW
jgi:hypothetical protein